MVSMDCHGHRIVCTTHTPEQLGFASYGMCSPVLERQDFLLVAAALQMTETKASVRRVLCWQTFASVSGVDMTYI
eukprot:1867955-Amphidinium_carterae.1